MEGDATVPDPLTDRTIFADTLRQLMEAAGLSGVVLARELGTHPTSISRWRNGEDRPRPELVSRLADILGVDRLALLRSAGYLQSESNEPPAPSLNPRLSRLLAEIEAGWLAMDSDAERDLAERGARALFAVQPTEHKGKSRIDGNPKRLEQRRRELLTGTDSSIENEPRRRKGLVTRSSAFREHVLGSLLAVFGLNRDSGQFAPAA